MSDLFHDRHGIRFLNRVLTQLNKVGEKLINIGEIKVARHYKVPAHPVVLPLERMAALHTILSKGAITQMTQQQLTAKRDVFFLPLSAFVTFGLLFLRVDEMVVDMAENMLGSFRFNRTHPVDVGSAGFRVELDRGHTCPILSAVDHLFHHLVKFVKTVPG
jgi:hypothetical protein